MDGGDVFFGGVFVVDEVVEDAAGDGGGVLGAEACVFNDHGEGHLGVFSRGVGNEEGVVAQAFVDRAGVVFFVLFDGEDLCGAGFASAGAASPAPAAVASIPCKNPRRGAEVCFIVHLKKNRI